MLEVPGQSGQRLRGRPLRLTDAVTETVCGALKEGAYAEEAAAMAGIGRSTYYMWLSRGRVARSRREEDLPVSVTDQGFLDFLDAVERASVAPEIEALMIIHRAAERGSWRVPDVMKTDISQPDLVEEQLESASQVAGRDGRSHDGADDVPGDLPVASGRSLKPPLAPPLAH